MLPSLTKAEKEILVFIAHYWDAEGLAPTLREIGTGKIKNRRVAKERTSPNGVRNLCKNLVKKGYLQKAGDNIKSTYYYPADNAETRRAIA